MFVSSILSLLYVDPAFSDMNIRQRSDLLVFGDLEFITGVKSDFLKRKCITMDGGLVRPSDSLDEL